MENENVENIRDLIEGDRQAKKQFLNTQIEKNFYLGEYKERVLAALTKHQLIEDDVYPEIIQFMERSEAYMLKMTREVELKKLKPYIQYAEKLGLKNELVDGLAYRGEVGLVIVSKEALENQPESLIIRDMDQDFIDAGLGDIFSKKRGHSICARHYKIVKEKLPRYTADFKKLNLFWRLIGMNCPICESEKKHRRK